jgi:hypothetical protein
LWLGRRKGYIDIGAEKLIIGAEKGNEKIAVEVKSFTGQSDLSQFEDALGQFLVYLPALEEKEPDRTLILAVPSGYHTRFFDDPYFLKIANRFGIKMLVYHESENKILSWTK